MTKDTETEGNEDSEDRLESGQSGLDFYELRLLL
jgi:hypothetical protein